MMWHIYLAAVIMGGLIIIVGMVGAAILFSQWLEAEQKRRLNQATFATKDIRRAASGELVHYDSDLGPFG